MIENLRTYTDYQLYELARNDRKSKAFEVLYERYSNGVYKYCLKIMGSEEMANDVFQDTFYKIFKGLEKEKEMTNIPAYVYRIARNNCLSAKKSKYFDQPSINGMSLKDSVKGHDKEMEHLELIRLMNSALDGLPPKFKEPLVLKEYDNLSYAQIAEVLQIKISTVKIRIYRAKQKLKDKLSPYIDDNKKKTRTLK